MSRLRAFGLFWYDFVVGDDWRIAVGLVAALGLTAVLVGLSIAAWWLLPLAVDRLARRVGAAGGARLLTLGPKCPCDAGRRTGRGSGRAL